MFDFTLPLMTLRDASALLLAFLQNETLPFILAFLFIIPLTILVIAGFWKVFTKAGEPGWASIVPIYNAIVLLKIAGKPGWWIFLLFIPLVNIVILIMVSIDLAANFGKGVGFGLGLAFLGAIFYPILGFGDARYMPRQQYPPPPPPYGGPAPPPYGGPAPPPYGSGPAPPYGGQGY